MGNAVAPAELIDKDNPTQFKQLDPHTNTNTDIDETKTDPPAIAVTTTIATTQSSVSMKPLQQLFYACSHGDVDLIRTAVSLGASVNEPDRGHEATITEEEKAEAKKSKKSKQQLKDEKEADQLLKNAPVTNDFPLHKAVEHGHLPSVELLYLLEANLECKNKLGSTPLHRAVSCQRVDIVKYLLSVGARIDAQNTAGNTPLHIASYEGNTEIATLLLNHRQDSWKLVQAANASGMTPVDYARKKAMAELLAQYRMTSSTTNSFMGPQTQAHEPHRLPTRSSFSINRENGVTIVTEANIHGSNSRRNSHNSSAGNSVGSAVRTLSGHGSTHRPNQPIAVHTTQPLPARNEDRLYSSSITAPLPPFTAHHSNPASTVDEDDDQADVEGRANAVTALAISSAASSDSEADNETMFKQPSFYKKTSMESINENIVSPTNAQSNANPLVPPTPTQPNAPLIIRAQSTSKDASQYSDLSLSMEQKN